MTIGTDFFRSIGYKEETTAGTAAGASGAQLVGFNSFDPGVSKDGYKSNDVNTSQQTRDFQHGVRRVAPKSSHDLRCGAYGDWLAAIVRKAWAATSSLTSLSLTVAASGSYYTITRASGSFLTDGIKAGFVVKLTAGSFDALNLNKHLLVLAVNSATVLLVTPVNGSAMTAEGPISSATMTVPGKTTYMPTSSHTDKSYTLADWASDKSERILLLGCKPVKAAFNLPTTGGAKISFDWMGMDFSRTTSAYFSSPTAASTAAMLTAVNGKLRVGSALVSNFTALDIAIMGGHSSDPVVGSNIVPAVLPGELTVDGSFTSYDESGTFFDAFDAATALSITLVMAAGTAAADSFMAITLPYSKIMLSGESKVGNGRVRNFKFQPSENTAGGSGIASEDTTILLQDSTL